MYARKNRCYNEVLEPITSVLAYPTVYVPHTGHYMYRQVQRSEILRSAHTVYLCVLYGSQNKQRLFPYTILTGWFL